MAKKKTEVKKNYFDSIGGVITTFLAVASVCVAAGYYFGRKETIRSYEAEIEDLKFRQLQMQIDFQKALVEEKMKWSSETITISFEEYKQLLQTPIVTKDGKKK
ncbi:MAG: hypothetical protein IJU13_09125 [Bacteroidales bacterium]|nr:hypothetical protein [Bacteroidales bacterium]